MHVVARKSTSRSVGIPLELSTIKGTHRGLRGDAVYDMGTRRMSSQEQQEFISSVEAPPPSPPPPSPQTRCHHRHHHHHLFFTLRSSLYASSSNSTAVLAKPAASEPASTELPPSRLPPSTPPSRPSTDTTNSIAMSTALGSSYAATLSNVCSASLEHCAVHSDHAMYA